MIVLESGTVNYVSVSTDGSTDSTNNMDNYVFPFYATTVLTGY